MNRIKKVETTDNYEIIVEFENGEKRIKDMKPYLDRGVFKPLKDKKFFNDVKIKFGTVCWGEDIDLYADNIYEESELINN